MLLVRVEHVAYLLVFFRIFRFVRCTAQSVVVYPSGEKFPTKHEILHRRRRSSARKETSASAREAH